MSVKNKGRQNSIIFTDIYFYFAWYLPSILDPPTTPPFKVRVPRMPIQIEIVMDSTAVTQVFNISKLSWVYSVHPSLDSITFACAVCLPACPACWWESPCSIEKLMRACRCQLDAWRCWFAPAQRSEVLQLCPACRLLHVFGLCARS